MRIGKISVYAIVMVALEALLVSCSVGGGGGATPGATTGGKNSVPTQS